MCHSAIWVCSCGRVKPSASGSIGPRTVWTWAMDRDATRSRHGSGAFRCAARPARSVDGADALSSRDAADPRRRAPTRDASIASGRCLGSRSSTGALTTRSTRGRLADPEVEILIARLGAGRPRSGCRGSAGSRSVRPASTTWPPIRRGGRACWSRTRVASTRSRSPNTSPGWSCGSTSRPRPGAQTRPPIAGRRATRRWSRSSAAGPR